MLPPPPTVETLRKIDNVVGIFMVKQGKKCYGNRVKCYENNCNVIVQKDFLPKKLLGRWGGNRFKMLLSGKIFVVGKVLPLPPPPQKKHGSHGTTVCSLGNGDIEVVRPQ
jgi:hypothetical protein